MSAYLNKKWFKYQLLVLFCAVIPLVLQVFGLPLLSNTPWVIWYLIALPILCSVIITLTSKNIGKFDWATLAAMELMLLLYAFITNDFSLSDASFPLYYALPLISIPAIETLVIAGIASAIVLRRQHRE